MATRTFQDSAGAVWEVFEVRRASSNPNGVSAGLERGWLTFVNGTQRRRLAPFPPDWEQAPAEALEELCGRARVALSRDGGAGGAWPRSAGRRGVREIGPGDATPVSDTTEPAILPAAISILAEVELTVREFAHQARTTGLPAIEAMVRLKSMLLERYPGAGQPARDMTRVRRWFVDAYYFERDV